MIQKNIHFVWAGPPMPDWAKTNVDRWAAMNPSFIVKVHGEEILWPSFRQAYDRIETEWAYGREERHEWSRKSDVLRVCALLDWGGWYFDVDCVPLRPLDELFAQYGNFPREAFLTPSDDKGWFANGIFGALQDSAFLAVIAAGLLHRARQPAMVGWGAYGPALYTELVNRHPALVHCGDVTDFFPYREQHEIREAYARLSRENYSPAVIRAVFGADAPFLLHLDMQDHLELETAS